MKMRIAGAILVLALGATGAWADLELIVDVEYPLRLELKIPVHEDSDFSIRTSFGTGEYFSVTGRIGRITGVGVRRNCELTYGCQYKLGDSSGSAGGSQSSPLDGSVKTRNIVSLRAANPRFVIREVDPPPLPAFALTNLTTAVASTNEAAVGMR